MPDDADAALAAKLSRLRRLMDQAAGMQQPPAPQGEPDPQPARIPAGTGTRPIEDVIRGTVLTSGRGSCFLSERVLPLSHRHGRWPLELALQTQRPELDWLSFPGFVECGCLEHAVFVDIETTGLAGGTGTMPFLIGIGFFDGSAFVIHQYLMRGPQEEGAALAAVASAVEDRDTIVSFNGKAFDLPILETRYVLGRQRFPFPADHVDLLFGARRVWAPRLESCRLANLEYRVLGVIRDDDVPGALVPQIYQDYLRTGDGRYLQPVFEHNLLDVLSLVTLAGRLGQLRREPLCALEDDPVDLAALGRSFERAARAQGGAGGDGPCAAQEGSILCYREALAAGLTGTGAARTLLALALLHKRRGERDAAVRCWQQLAALGGIGDQDGTGTSCTADPASVRSALVELAKHHEHTTRDLVAALHYAERAVQLAATPADREALRHRIARLEARRSRQPA